MSKKGLPRRPLRWTARALRDLAEIRSYIAKDDPRAAERWIRRLLGRVESAARFPLAGRALPEFKQDDAREVLLRTCRIVYVVRGRTIDVLTVFEGHRRAWFEHEED